MKLLLDQNISFRVQNAASKHFPSIAHVSSVGLMNSTDRQIWNFAKSEGFTIVTFDTDFYDFGLVWGSPPKVILLRSHCQTTPNIAKMLELHRDSIFDFLDTADLACLEIVDSNFKRGE